MKSIILIWGFSIDRLITVIENNWPQEKREYARYYADYLRDVISYW